MLPQVTPHKKVVTQLFQQEIAILKSWVARYLDIYIFIHKHRATFHKLLFWLVDQY